MSSRHHAAICYNNEMIMFIIDLNSSYGTTVDGIQIESFVPMPLNEGSIVRFGMSARKYVVVKKSSLNTSNDKANEEEEEEEDEDEDEEEEEDIEKERNLKRSRASNPMSISAMLGEPIEMNKKMKSDGP